MTATDDFVLADFPSSGLYRIWYSRSYLPAGPFPDLATLADTLMLADYPSDGYLAHVDEPGNPPTIISSLNPDELYQPACVVCATAIRKVGNEWVHTDLFDRDGDLDTAARCEDADDLVLRDRAGEPATADPGDDFDTDGLAGEMPPPAVTDTAGALVDDYTHGADPHTIAATLERLRPKHAAVSIRQVNSLGSFSAGDNLEQTLVTQVADAAWDRNLNAVELVSDLWHHAGRSLPPNWRAALDRRIPPLTGTARRHAADALVATGQASSRRAAYTTIDRRDHDTLDVAAVKVLHDLADATPAAASNVALLLNTAGTRATLPDPTTVALTTGTDRPVWIARSRDWSTIVNADRPDHGHPTGLATGERDPWTVARAIRRTVEPAT